MTMGQTLTAVTVGLEKHTALAIRSGLASLAEVTGTFPDFARAVQSISKLQPDLVFLDFSKGAAAGIETLKNILAQVPSTRVFLVDQGNDPQKVMDGFRNGALDFIPPDLPGPQILARVRQALSRTESSIQKGRVLTLFSLKGGLGVTCLSINLADQIRDITAGKVLLLDLNLFMGDITAYLDIEPEFTPFELSADMTRMDKDLLFSSLFRHETGLYVLTTREEINDSEAVSGQDVSDMIGFLRDHFDYIIVDASHEFSQQTLEALACTDTLLTLAIQSIPSAKRVKKIVDFLQDIDFKPETLNIVLNRYLKRSEFKKNDLERIFNQDISFTLDNDYKLLNQAAGKGTFLRQVNPNARLTRQIRQMAADLTGIGTTGKTGWRKLLSGGRT